jgi:4-hydroxy-4-methyl-2-oxoglutarate aldolase
MTRNMVVRKIPRANGEVIRELGELGVATVHEAMGQTGLMHAYMRPIFPGARAAGSAITVEVENGDNLMLHAAMEVCQRGDIMVVAVCGSDGEDFGMFGDLLGTCCQTRGVVGLVIEAGVRDTSELTAMDFPVWSKAISARGTTKERAGAVNLPAVCAGAAVNPGDVILGDADGVVVVPRERAAEVLTLGKQRLEREEHTRERLRNGELGVDFYSLREKLKQLGVEYLNE